MRHGIGEGRRARRWWVLAVGVLVVVSAGCGSKLDDTTATDSGETGSSESSPFTVGPVPEGYKLAVAGTATYVDNCCGDSARPPEPYTVLSPDGTATGPEVVVVWIFGFDGSERGLDWTPNDTPNEVVEKFTVDGKYARYAPAWTDDRGENWAYLVAAWGDDLAVRVRSRDATREELLAVLEEVEVGPDHTRAPAVPDPPDGLQVVGSVDVDGVLALEPRHVVANSDSVPGPAASHIAGWLANGSGGNDQLSVLTLPGRSVDLPAIAVQDLLWGPPAKSESHEREVGGRPALFIETFIETNYDRSVWVDSAWGDTVVVTARGPSTLSEDELVALAASVEPADEAAWEAFVIEAAGGPGLHADEGRTELARGQAGDLEWLLQSGPGGGVDPCLKLSNRKRACTGTGVGSGSHGVHISAEPEEDIPAFVVVSTTLEAASVRVTTPTDEATVPLVPVPGGGLWAAAVFVDSPGFPVCGETAVGTPVVPGVLTVTRVDALDAQGQVVGCLGWGTAAYPEGG